MRTKNRTPLAIVSLFALVWITAVAVLDSLAGAARWDDPAGYALREAWLIVLAAPFVFLAALFVLSLLGLVAVAVWSGIDNLIHREKYARLDVIDKALLDVSPAWFLDALGAPERTDDDALVRMVADLPEGTEYALARAHRKGVKADDVAPLIAAGTFTEADADRLAREVA